MMYKAQLELLEYDKAKLEDECVRDKQKISELNEILSQQAEELSLLVQTGMNKNLELERMRKDNEKLKKEKTEAIDQSLTNKNLTK